VRFSPDAHAGLADGSTTVTFRAWKRPQVKVGGHYRVGPVTLEVDSLTQVRMGDVDDPTARKWLKAVPHDELVWRVDFHVAGPAVDPRRVLAAVADLDADDVAAIDRRLDRLDAANPRGAWTRSTLRQIEASPGVVSTDLAAAVGVERARYKVDVRKLKALGLTESLEVGYRLSPRGEAYLRAISDPA
jgi:hypothetical protein